MALRDQAANALGHLACGSPLPQILHAQEGGQSLSCELVALDTLGCAFNRLAVSSDKLAGTAIADLKRVAESLSKKLTYLLEPISPIEVDADRCVVQLRSNPPQKDGDRSAYYELLVCATGEMSLCRYSKQPGGQRQAIPAQVTREVLLRLIGDFSTAA